jgi:hypothetical protein
MYIQKRMTQEKKKRERDKTEAEGGTKSYLGQALASVSSFP